MASFTEQTREYLGTVVLPPNLTQSGGITSVTISNAGTGQANGTYRMTATDDSGTALESGFLATVTVAGAVVTAVDVVHTGSNYAGNVTFDISGTIGGSSLSLTPVIGTSSDVISDDLISEAIDDVIMGVANTASELLIMFAKKSGDLGVNIDGTEHKVEGSYIPLVTANGIPASQIPVAMSYLYTKAGSLYKRTDEDPAFWIDGDGYIKSTTIATGEWNVYDCKSGNAVINSSAGTITGMNWPAQYNEAIPLYCAIRILLHRMMGMNNFLAKHTDSAAEYTDASGAPLNQQQYEALATNEGWEVVRYLVETAEDPELASAKASQLTGEQQQFATEYQWIGSQIPILQQQYTRIISSGKETGASE
jgi:hypothetical protein